MTFKLESWIKEYRKALLELKVNSKIMSELTGLNVTIKADSP